jgi:hypothetical protein
MCITIKVIIGLILLIQAWRLVSKGGKRTLVGCLCIWFAIGALGSAALGIFRIVDSRALQPTPMATVVPTPMPMPTPTPIKRSIKDSCDFNCEQYESKTWDPYLGYDTLEYLECLDNQDRCEEAIINAIENKADSWEREMKEPQNGLPDLDKYDPSDWDPMW